MTKHNFTIFLDGPKNEDWPKADPKIKEEELKAIEDARKEHQKEIADGSATA
jgi:hypothetical protein